MELNTLGELIREDDPDGVSPQTVDRVVTGAVRRGRRTRTAWQAAGGLATCALLVGGVAVAAQWPGPAVEIAPGGPPATTSVRPSATATSSPMPASSTPTPTATRVKPPTQREVLAVLTAGLPSRFEVGQARLKDRSPESGVSTSFVVTDRAGQAFVGGGVDPAINLTCDPKTCTRKALAGGTVLVLRSPAGEKTGDGTWYYYERPDGGWVWLGQDNALNGGKAPVSRPELPLTEAEVRTLLTAPGWDPLVKRCRAAGPAC